MVTNLPTNLKANATSPRCRAGVSIIEVLTSIVVAMIGVVGVMVLIPFAVRQAQTGLDLDDSYLVGQNAIEEFQLRGYTNPITWVGEFGPADDGTGVPWGSPAATRTHQGGLSAFALGAPVPDAGLTIVPSNPIFRSFVPLAVQPRPFVIDPLGIMENNSTFDEARFPFQMVDLNHFLGTGNPTYPVWWDGTSANTAFALGGSGSSVPAAQAWAGLDFRALTVSKSALAGGAITKQQARSLMRSTDDVVFGPPAVDNTDPIDPQGDLKPPVQLFDQVGGISVRRQANGSVSWIGLVMPNKNSSIDSPATDPLVAQTRPSGFKMYVLVFKDRDATSFPDPSNVFGTPGVAFPAGAMVTTSVDLTGLPTAGTPDGPGIVSPVTRLNFDGGAQGVVQRDDWVMLINRRQTRGVYDFVNDTHIDDPLAGSGLSTVTANGHALSGDLAEVGYERQVAFYRVRGVTSVQDPLSGVIRSALDVDGPDFDFGNSAPADPDTNTNVRSATYLVHLKDVVNVYERTFSIEEDSTWIPN